MTNIYRMYPTELNLDNVNKQKKTMYRRSRSAWVGVRVRVRPLIILTWLRPKNITATGMELTGVPFAGLPQNMNPWPDVYFVSFIIMIETRDDDVDVGDDNVGENDDVDDEFSPRNLVFLIATGDQILRPATRNLK